jgi:hypothetical protein
MATYANHLELFAEQIGTTGEQLGNFPQAFTHLAVINAAFSLDDLLNRSERVEDLAHVGVGQANISLPTAAKRCGCHKVIDLALGESAT